VTLVTDATAAKTNEIAQANIIDIRNIGVDCIDTNMCISKMRRAKQ